MYDFYAVCIILFMVFMQIIGLFCAALMDSKITKQDRVVILVNCFFTSILVIQNYLECHLGYDNSNYYLRTIVGILGYTLRPLILMMWIYLMRNNQKLIFAWVIVIINTLIHLTALFSGICFSITTENKFVRGPLGYTCHVVSGILLLYLFWLSTEKYTESLNSKIDNDKSSSTEIKKYQYGLEGLSLSALVIIIVLSVVMDSKIYSEDVPITFLTAAIATCNVFYYIWLRFSFSDKIQK